MADHSCKLLVVGGGPGGYVTAIRAGQLGIDTILVEKTALGGTCLTVGCIPSKALIHAADRFHEIAASSGTPSALGISVARPSLDFSATMGWKDGIVDRLTSGVGALLRKAKVRVLTGKATFTDGKTVEVAMADGERALVRAEQVVIATGSEPIELPFLPFGGPVMSSTEALALQEVPERLAIIGAGYIGLEIGTAFAKLGARVTIVEAEDRILPLYDAELTRPVAKRLEALGVSVLTSVKAKGMNAEESALEIETADGTRDSVPADKVLVTVGRRPVLDGFGLADLGLEREGRFLRIDSQCRTSMRGVFAIGDVTGEPMLAHRAMAQGEMVAELVAGKKRAWDKVSIPAICFTDPEILSVGLSPQEAAAKGIDTVCGSFPFRANGRAMTLEREDGFVRVTARASDHLVLGLQAVGAGISEMASGFSLALEMGARLEDIAETIHAHPSQGEALQEAALSALGHAIHI